MHRGGSRGRCTIQGRPFLDAALAVVLGGDCLADVGTPRAEPGMFGPVACDPTVSRPVDALATAGPKTLSAIRTAQAEARLEADRHCGAGYRGGR